MSKLLLATKGLSVMILPALAGFSIALFPTPSVAAAQEAAPARQQTEQKRITIAATDLAGADAELGKFLTDTLITDLAHSRRLAPLERATVQESLERLQAVGGKDRALTAGEIRRLGAATEADYVLVGSFLVRDSQLVVNARLINAQTGLTAPGGAISASGSSNDLLNTAHRLSRQLHKRMTDEELVIEDAPVPQIALDGHAAANLVPITLTPVDDLARFKKLGIIPAAAREAAALTDADLATLIKSIAKVIKPQSDSATVLSQTTGGVTRVRALAAVVRLQVGPEDLANYRTAPPAQMPPDTAQTAVWGVPYLAAAVDQGWWQADREFNGKDPATWGFIAQVLSKLPLPKVEDAPAKPALQLDPEPYTGLVIDAIDYAVERSMSPRILDESGSVLYPDPSHVPSDDYVMDHGMVSYYVNAADAKRAGRHPLLVRAIKVSVVGHDDLIVSNETADLIREANRRNSFLFRWNVAVLAPAKGSDPAPTRKVPDTVPLPKPPDTAPPTQNPPPPPVSPAGNPAAP